MRIADEIIRRSRLDNPANEKMCRIGSRRLQQRRRYTGEGKANRHFEPHSGTVAHLDFTAMKFHGPLRDCQSQADSAGRTFP